MLLMSKTLAIQRRKRNFSKLINSRGMMIPKLLVNLKTREYVSKNTSLYNFT